MENENTPIVYGELSDPLVQERLKAVSKLNPPETVKSRHLVQVTETVKVATAFGETAKEVTVEKEVEPIAPKSEDEKKAALEEELDRQLKQKLGHAAVPVAPERLEKAKEIREALAGLWSTDASQTNADGDVYITIDGLGSAQGRRNTNSGDSGVRITFKR